MKKVLLILSITLVLLLAGLPWLIGVQLEKHLPAQIAANAQHAARYGLAIHLRNYQRNYLGSQGELLIMYQPPGQQIPLYQGVATLDIRHAPVLASGFDFISAQLRSDNDAQGVFAEYLPADFLHAAATLGMNGKLRLEARLQSAAGNLLPRPSNPQHLAFHGANFHWQSTLTGYPERGQGNLQLAGLTFTDPEQRWHLAPLRIDFKSRDRYEGEALLPEFLLQHSVHALSSREQLTLGPLHVTMQQGLNADGVPYPQILNYHIADLRWVHEHPEQNITQHFAALKLNVALRPADSKPPSAVLRASGKALQLTLPGSWQDIAPEHFETTLSVQPITPDEAMQLLDRLRHPLPPAPYLPLPAILSHLTPHPGVSRALHYLARHMAQDKVSIHWQLAFNKGQHALLQSEMILEEALDATDSTAALDTLAAAIDKPETLPPLLNGSRLHLNIAADAVRKSGLGLALLFSGTSARWLKDDGSLQIDALISPDSITVNNQAYP